MPALLCPISGHLKPQFPTIFLFPSGQCLQLTRKEAAEEATRSGTASCLDMTTAGAEEAQETLQALLHRRK